VGAFRGDPIGELSARYGGEVVKKKHVCWKATRPYPQPAAASSQQRVDGEYVLADEIESVRNINA